MPWTPNGINELLARDSSLRLVIPWYDVATFQTSTSEATDAVNLDLLILVGLLMVIVLPLVWDRATTVGPVLFTWAGVAAGGVVAFVLHYDPRIDRVDIGHILPGTAFGAGVGLLIGFVVREAYLRGSNRRRAALEASAGAALAAGLGLVYGWIGYRLDDNTILMAFACSAASAVVGAALALLNWWLRSRRQTSKPEESSGG